MHGIGLLISIQYVSGTGLGVRGLRGGVCTVPGGALPRRAHVENRSDLAQLLNPSAGSWGWVRN